MFFNILLFLDTLTKSIFWQKKDWCWLFLFSSKLFSPFPSPVNDNNVLSLFCQNKIVRTIACSTKLSSEPTIWEVQFLFKNSCNFVGQKQLQIYRSFYVSLSKLIRTTKHCRIVMPAKHFLRLLNRCLVVCSYI